MNRIYVLAIALAIVGCEYQKKDGSTTENTDKPKQKENVVISLLGDTLAEPTRSAQAQARLDSNLAVAKKDFEADPNEINTIWYGRRKAYMSHYDDAIAIYTKGISAFPGSYKMYRHRGHRYISTRQFDKAITDYQKAVELMPKDALEIEPDGIPNKLNKPLGTTQFNVWYHYGLAYYLMGEFDKAEEAYRECLEVSNNDDLLCATVDWLYMTLRRQNKKEEAKELLDLIHEDMEIIENDSYHKRLLMYKGLVEPDMLLTVGPDNPDPDLAIATQGYGVGNWYYYNGDTARARGIFEKVLSGKHWSAFGFIAAEADLARM